MCDCIEKVNTAVRERYEDPEAELNVGFTFGTNTLAVKPSGLAATYRRKKKDGSYGIVKYTANIIPVFCPFCGEKYDKEAQG